MSHSNPNLRPLLVVFAGVMAITAMVLNGITWSKVRSSIDALEIALRQRDDWKELLSTLKDAETGVRGYVITGEESYLKPLQDADESLNRILGDLRLSARTEGENQATIDEIEALVRARMDALKEVRLVREREEFEAARALIVVGESKSLMDEVRQTVTSLTKTHETVVREKTAAMNGYLRWGYASALAAGMVAIGAGLVALLLLRESIAHARREQRLAEEKRRAESSNREKSIFLATMSHEIRTPMNAILGFGELLRDHVEDKKGRKYAESILVGGRSLLQIINDILDLSKVEAGMLELKSEPTDLRETTRFIQQLFSHEASKRGVELRVDVQEDLPASLLIDNLRLRQILVNVVGNALKFTERGHVNLRVRDTLPEGDHSRVNISIEVEDTGKGIPKEQQEAVFSPFVQAPGTRAADVRGTGLGLAIVHRLTGLMGGNVTLDSEPGRGSLFRFEFPDIEISARLAQTSLETSEDQVDFNDLRPSSILVTDDNQTNLDLVAGIFEESHHSLRLAHNGQEALDAIAEELPDLVMMDVRMPVMDGREALAAIRANSEWKLLPVIAVTASSLPDELEGVLGSFDGYVRKPFSRAQLYEQLAQFIHPSEDSDDDSLADTSGSGYPQTPEVAEKWRVLAERLAEIREADWPGVRDGLVVSEILAFATKLDTLASESQCGPLDTYSRRLRSDADSFSPAALEKSLQHFPSIIAAILAACEPTSP
jgi:signal transduction histidine kinase/DNA-binding NarL/FixJ family response regulator